LTKHTMPLDWMSDGTGALPSPAGDDVKNLPKRDASSVSWGPLRSRGAAAAAVLLIACCVTAVARCRLAVPSQDSGAVGTADLRNSSNSTDILIENLGETFNSSIGDTSNSLDPSVHDRCRNRPCFEPAQVQVARTKNGFPSF
jgi:hypothetical protein